MACGPNPACCLIIKFYWDTATPIHLQIAVAAFKLWSLIEQRPYGLQNRKYLFSDPLLKTFANPCSTHDSICGFYKGSIGYR